MREISYFCLRLPTAFPSAITEEVFFRRVLLIPAIVPSVGNRRFVACSLGSSSTGLGRFSSIQKIRSPPKLADVFRTKTECAALGSAGISVRPDRIFDRSSTFQIKTANAAILKPAFRRVSLWCEELLDKMPIYRRF